MALNYPGPYQVRVFYTTDVAPGGPIVHQMRLNCDIDGAPVTGTPFTEIGCNKRLGEPVLLHTVMTQLMDRLEDIYSAADTVINYAELWKYGVASFDAVYISTYDLSTPGVDLSDAVPCSQSYFTFRTFGGGAFKLSLMETVIPSETPVAYGDLGVDETAIADFFTGDSTSYFWARDNTYPHVCLRRNASQNEATFRQRFR